MTKKTLSHSEQQYHQFWLAIDGIHKVFDEISRQTKRYDEDIYYLRLRIEEAADEHMHYTSVHGWSPEALRASGFSGAHAEFQRFTSTLELG